MIIRALCLLGLMTLAVAVPSQVKAENSGRLPDGVTSLTLSVTERQTVKKDLLVASLRYEVKGKDAKVVQKEINEKVAAGLAVIKKEPAIKLSTQAYNVYMTQDQKVEIRDGKKVIERNEEWRGSQTILMESKDEGKLKNITAQLQDMGFIVNQYNYTLSREQAEKVRETLMQGAINKIKAQADQTTKLLGKRGYDIREVAVEGGYIQPMPMFRAMAMDAVAESMPTPNAEAGEEDVTLTLNARVELK